ncbi:MAG TPA: hypothetical protein VE546_20730 [Streptomyces sp.]|uniref:hypothetical protein n=1 Tax=Streptomyces sp. TaxID=1931 RepID=UPI002D760F01|nr:hypothetical protein [Streptomyces sp.]HZG05969.1 hypothetical protein [Streptomyces sp.]
MEISFHKLPGDRYEIVVRGRRGPDVRLPPRPTGPTIPHDLVHAAVEEALGLTDGFWDAVAQGAAFEGFEPLAPGRHRAPGPGVLRRKGEAVMRAELAVAWAYRVWSGPAGECRGVGRAPIDAAQTAVARAALDEAATRWAAVPEGGVLRWEW